MIKTWQQRCEEHPDHDGIVTERMIQARMQEEIDDLRAAIEQAQPEMAPAFRSSHAYSVGFKDGLAAQQIQTVPAKGGLAEKVPVTGTSLEPIVRKAFDRIYEEQDPRRWEDQEPVAWANPKWLNPKTRHWTNDTILSKPIEGWIPLYTAPRQWKGLTDEEIAEVRHLYDWSAGWTFERFARQIEAKLREKNHG